MATVFIGDRSVAKADLREAAIARAGGVNRNPASEKKVVVSPPNPGGKVKTKANPPAVPPKEGKADGVGRNPKDV